MAECVTHRMAWKGWGVFVYTRCSNITLNTFVLHWTSPCILFSTQFFSIRDVTLECLVELLFIINLKLFRMMCSSVLLFICKIKSILILGWCEVKNLPSDKMIRLECFQGTQDTTSLNRKKKKIYNFVHKISNILTFKQGVIHHVIFGQTKLSTISNFITWIFLLSWVVLKMWLDLPCY